VWNGHRIRRDRNQRNTHGRPLVIYSVPHMYNTQDYACPADQHILVSE